MQLMNHKRFNTEEELKFLEEVLTHVREGTMSLRVGARYLADMTGKVISHEGLRKIINNVNRTDN